MEDCQWVEPEKQRVAEQRASECQCHEPLAKRRPRQPSPRGIGSKTFHAFLEEADRASVSTEPAGIDQGQEQHWQRKQGQDADGAQADGRAHGKKRAQGRRQDGRRRFLTQRPGQRDEGHQGQPAACWPEPASARALRVTWLRRRHGRSLARESHERTGARISGKSRGRKGRMRLAVPNGRRTDFLSHLGQRIGRSFLRSLAPNRVLADACAVGVRGGGLARVALPRAHPGHLRRGRGAFRLPRRLPRRW